MFTCAESSLPSGSLRKTIGFWLAMSVVLATSCLISPHRLAYWPSWLSLTQTAFGQEKPGELHLLFELPEQDLLHQRIEATRDAIRARLRADKIGYIGLEGSGHIVQVRIREAADIDRAKTALADLLLPTTFGTNEGGSILEWLLPAWVGADETPSIVELSLQEPEPGLFKYMLTEAGIEFRVSSAIQVSTEVIRRRVNELGLDAPLIDRQGTDRIVVKVHGVSDPQRLTYILGQAATLTFRLVNESMPVHEALNGSPPAGSTIIYSTDEPPVPYLIEDRVLVTGENLVDAEAVQDQLTGQPIISFRFDKEGARRFGQATQENVGRQIAIIVDGKVLSAPAIREPILGGSGQISGNFTEQSARDLAVLLRTGPMPAKLVLVAQRFVPDKP